MRRRRVLLVALGCALLFAAIGASAVLFRPSPPLGPAISIPADVWVAVDPVTFAPDVDRPPRLVWPPSQDLEVAGFDASWRAGDPGAPHLSLQWEADLGERMRHRIGLGSSGGLTELRIRYAACDEFRADAGGTWRRYRGRQSDLDVDSAQALVNLGSIAGAPTGPIVVRSPGSIRIGPVPPAGSTPSRR